jgi:A/G-specific adenine glycosylase
VWFAENQRTLPWRNVKDPYAIWISEVMLQQTQVQTVIPYFLRFLKSFPRVTDLARSETDRLLKEWAGLGYYSRARNLQKAARMIVDQFAGKFPKNYDDVLRLPGVGAYTAAAILSIAFDQPFAVLDGNVTRVLVRLLNIRGNAKSSTVQRNLRSAAQQLLPEVNPGDFNQAVMELGATLCSPRRPKCLFCPWQKECLAWREGVQEELPEKGSRPAIRRSYQAAAVIRHRGRYLIIRRAGHRLLEGFWEFPVTEFEEREGAADSLSRWLLENYDLRIHHLRPYMTVNHSITTRRIELNVFQAELDAGAKPHTQRRDCRWIRLSESNRYPFAAASRKVVQALIAGAGSHN